MLTRRSSVELVVKMTDIWSVYKYYILRGIYIYIFEYVHTSRIKKRDEKTPTHATRVMPTFRELQLEPGTRFTSSSTRSLGLCGHMEK